jgi:hypothetical protein
MATVFYRSLNDAEVIDVEFLTLQGRARSLKLLVDSGFSGKSSVVLSNDASELVRAEVPPAEATGALQGAQNRGWVTCRILELGFLSTVIAIIADISPLSLPREVQGVAGLRFLRQFARWGAERTANGWQFFLSNGND